MNEEVRLENNKVLVTSIEVIKIDEILDNKIRIKTVTPVEVHSTLKKADSGDFTHFYEPAEKDFSRLICENMQKKWSSLHDGEECKYSLKIYPVKKELMRVSRQSFKGFFIKAWHAHFWMKGDKELLELALESGIGSKCFNKFFKFYYIHTSFKRNISNTS